MPYQAKYTWSPKYIALPGAFAFIALMIFNYSEYKIRFLDWGLGALVTFLIVGFFAVRGAVVAKELVFLGVPLLWMAYALLGTPFAYDAGHHLLMLGKVASLSVLASFVIIAVFTRERLSQVVLITGAVWVVVNLGLLCAWVLGWFTYADEAFSGLFGNRNVFAVQSVIMAALLLLFVDRHRAWVWTLAALCGLMVAASLSVKGVLFFLFVVLFPLTLQVPFRRKLLTAAVGGLLCVGAYVAVPNMPVRVQRFALVFTSPDELRPTESAFLRSWLIVEGLKVSFRNPGFGVGVDNARFVLIPAGGKWATSDLGVGSHSNYIEMLLNAGIIGWLLHYVPLLYIYARLNGRRRYYRATTTLTALYLLLGIAMVQYNVFATVFLYSLIVFLYVYPHKAPSRSYPRELSTSRSPRPLAPVAYR